MRTQTPLPGGSASATLSPSRLPATEQADPLGTIVELHAGQLPRVGVWVMPDNEVDRDAGRFRPLTGAAGDDALWHRLKSV